MVWVNRVASSISLTTTKDVAIVCVEQCRALSERLLEKS
jgi:hypothetical protein